LTDFMSTPSMLRRHTRRLPRRSSGERCGSDPFEVLVGVRPADPRDRCQLHAVFQPQLVDLLDLRPTDAAADGEVLVATVEGEDDRLGEAGEGDAVGQSDVLHAHLSGQFDLARLDDQDVGAFGDVVGGHVERPGDVGDHAARFDAHDVEHLLSGGRGRRHDHVHVRERGRRVGRDVDDGARVFSFDLLLDLEQLGGLRRDEPDLVGGEREQAGAHRADRAGGADDHRLAVQESVVVGFHDPEPAHRLVGRPQRARGAVAVAGGHRQWRLLRHGDAGVADHLGERAEAHDLGPETTGQLCGLEQP
jgi:hypothetical protein